MCLDCQAHETLFSIFFSAKSKIINLSGFSQAVWQGTHGSGFWADVQPAFPVTSSDDVRVTHRLPCLLLAEINTLPWGACTRHVKSSQVSCVMISETRESLSLISQWPYACEHYLKWKILGKWIRKIISPPCPSTGLKSLQFSGDVRLWITVFKIR